MRWLSAGRLTQYCDAHPGDSTVGICRCNENFYLKDCSARHCPGVVTRFDSQTPPQRPLVQADFMECLDRGACDPATGLCACAAPYDGPDCALVKCPVRNGRICGGDGRCDSTTGACICNDGFYGTDCGSRYCPKVGGKECAGRGTCERSTGMCQCAQGFSAVDCSTGSGQKNALTCDGTAATGC